MTEAASSRPADAAVRVESVSKQFGKGGVLALDDIDLVVERGEFVSLLGPSGCGKSTLLRLVADLDTPTSGRLTVNGKTPHQARLDRDYGMVFQQAGLFEWRTAVRNVELPLRLMGFTPSSARPGRWRRSSSFSSPSSPTTTRGSCRAGCSSGCRSPAPSPSDHSCC